MDATALVALLQESLQGISVESAPSLDRQPTVFIARDDVPTVMRTLRDRPELAFTVLSELTATDYWPREPRFEVMYLLLSIEHRLRLRVKVRLSDADAHVATVVGVWPGANWLEREIWDLFGIVFDQHPDLRRLLMPEDWEGHPLRKDYPVQIHMKPETGQPMQMTPEEFRANLEKDRRARQ